MESKLKSKIAYVDSGWSAGTVSNEGFIGPKSKANEGLIGFKSDQKWGRQMQMQIKTDKNDSLDPTLIQIQIQIQWSLYWIRIWSKVRETDGDAKRCCKVGRIKTVENLSDGETLKILEAFLRLLLLLPIKSAELVEALGGIKSASRWQAGIKVKQQSITFAVTLKRWHQGGTSKYYFKKMASRWSSKVLSLLLLLKRWHQGETAKYYFKKVASRWNSKMKGGIKVASRYYF